MNEEEIAEQIFNECPYTACRGKKLEAENRVFTKLLKICKAIMVYNEHVPTGSDQYMLRGDMFRIMEEIVKKGSVK